MVAEALVEQQPLPEIPQLLRPGAWDELDSLVALGDFSEMLLPSELPSPRPPCSIWRNYWMCAAATILWCCCGS